VAAGTEKIREPGAQFAIGFKACDADRVEPELQGFLAENGIEIGRRGDRVGQGIEGG
jgi:hypothetical protein